MKKYEEMEEAGGKGERKKGLYACKIRDDVNGCSNSEDQLCISFCEM